MTLDLQLSSHSSHPAASPGTHAPWACSARDLLLCPYAGGSLYLLLRNGINQLRRFHSQRMGQLDDIDYAYIPLPSLNPTNVVSVEISQFS